LIFTETRLKGSYVIEPEMQEDERGYFARTFCQEEFRARGLNPRVVQCSVSFNKHKGTLRGMHYQVAPHLEAKLVSCMRGAIFDVIIDLRPDSSTYSQWFAAELSAENYKILYVPEGVAHGFQTLVHNTVVFYQISEFYHPESATGVRWDDPMYGITWPLETQAISDRDASYPLMDVRKEQT